MGKLKAVSRLLLKRAWGRKKEKAEGEVERRVIGVLTFEVAGLMCKAVHLWQALSDERIGKLRDDAMRLEGVRKLVSEDDDFLLGLVIAEIMDSVRALARSVARLGKWCADPLLQHFEHVIADLVSKASYPYRFEFTGKKMDGEVKKMEKFIAAASNLYQEIEVLADMEQGLRRMQAISEMTGQGEGLAAFKRRIGWQRQAVKRLQEVSVWNRSYDYTVLLLARSLFTIVGRMKIIFGFQHDEYACDPRTMGRFSRSYFPFSGLLRPLGRRSGVRRFDQFASGPIMKNGKADRRGLMQGTLGEKSLAKHWSPMAGGNSMPLLNASVPVEGGFCRSKYAAARVSDEAVGDDDLGPPVNILNTNLSLYLLDSKRKLLNAPPSTLGAAALSLHYANIIVTIEKLAMSPISIGPSVRDELYNMLPGSIRMALRMRLRGYANNLGSSVYDPALAAEWSDAMTRILEWLSPLAHNMVMWQSARSFEQQRWASSTSVLLIQTLYYANQVKTEAAIAELLVGLNYLWRFGKELNSKAVQDCANGRNLNRSWQTKCKIHTIGR